MLSVRLFSAALLTMAGPASASSIGTSAAAEGPLLDVAGKAPGQSWELYCQATLALPGGEVTLSRTYALDGTMEGGDFYRWTPVWYDPSKRAVPLDFTLSYVWAPEDQSTVALREIDFKYVVTTGTPLPEVSDMRFQRPFPVRYGGIVSRAALSTSVLPYSPYEFNKTKGGGDLPLGDLLAYGEGFEELDWMLVSPSSVLGGQARLEQGKLALGPLREAVAALPRLRDMLAEMTRDPAANCKKRIAFPRIPHPRP